jgi:hypothetical protein
VAVSRSALRRDASGWHPWNRSVVQSVDCELPVSREAQSWLPTSSLFRLSLEAVDAKLRRSSRAEEYGWLGYRAASYVCSHLYGFDGRTLSDQPMDRGADRAPQQLVRAAAGERLRGRCWRLGTRLQAIARAWLRDEPQHAPRGGMLNEGAPGFHPACRSSSSVLRVSGFPGLQNKTFPGPYGYAANHQLTRH